MTNFKRQINNHLKDFGKTELIDSHWVDRMVYVLAKIIEVEDIMDVEGMTQISEKNRFIVKNGHAQVYEGLLKSYASISIKLGLSPKDRERWIKQTKSKNDGGLIK